MCHAVKVIKATIEWNEVAKLYLAARVLHEINWMN